MQGKLSMLPGHDGHGTKISLPIGRLMTMRVDAKNKDTISLLGGKFRGISHFLFYIFFIFYYTIFCSVHILFFMEKSNVM